MRRERCPRSTSHKQTYVNRTFTRAFLQHVIHGYHMECCGLFCTDSCLLTHYWKGVHYMRFIKYRVLPYPGCVIVYIYITTGYVHANSTSDGVLYHLHDRSFPGNFVVPLYKKKVRPPVRVIVPFLAPTCRCI